MLWQKISLHYKPDGIRVSNTLLDVKKTRMAERTIITLMFRRGGDDLPEHGRGSARRPRPLCLAANALRLASGEISQWFCKPFEKIICVKNIHT